MSFHPILIKVISIFRGPVESQSGHHGVTMEIVFRHEKPEANNMHTGKDKHSFGEFTCLLNTGNANFLLIQAPPNMRTSKRAFENCNRERQDV